MTSVVVIDKPNTARLAQPGSGLRSSESAPAGDPKLEAVHVFAAWVQDQHARGALAMPAENLMEVQPVLGRQFCIGLHDMRYFIGVPKAFGPWFRHLPWLCVTVCPGSATLSLLCAAASARGISTSPFRLAFEIEPASYTRGLAHYHYLDVRLVDPIPAEGGAFRISREVVLTLGIRIVRSEDEAQSLLASIDP